MFFFMPIAFNRVLFIYILAAIIPAIFLMRYIYKHDTIEKEPLGLILAPPLVMELSKAVGLIKHAQRK